MEKKIINTPEAPEPIGPYSQAVQAGSFLFVSGQVAINPASGNVEAQDIIVETQQTLLVLCNHKDIEPNNEDAHLILMQVNG